MSPSTTLPDGRKVTLADEIHDRVSAEVVVAEGAAVRPEPAVQAETAALARRLRAEHAGRRPGEIPGLQEARKLYNAFGMEPTRYRPSSEALLRRVLQEKEITAVNNAVDCGNLAALSFLLPLGLYDLDRVEGDVVLRVGRPGEEYPGIRKGAVHLEGRLGLFDAAGPFGSPTSDSLRTSVQAGTTRLLAVIMATAGYPPDRLAAHAGMLGDLCTRHCRARTVVHHRLAVATAGAP
ncbi:MAG: phenylalanine--tRNA ligase beta subunit-related protein [Candidatus Krumholzibacteriia bacterium]